MSHREREPPPQRPRHVKKACVVCHSRKVRCDGATNGFPCTNCKIANLECTVAARRKRRRAITTENLSPEQRPRVRIRTAALEREPQTGGESTAAPSPEPAQSPSRNGPSSRGGKDESDQELAKQHLVGFFSQDLQHSPIRARLTYVGNELSNLNFLTRQRALNHHVYHYPCDNPYVPRVYKNARTSETATQIPKDAFILPPKHIADVLVDAFFKFVYPTFPVINKDGFLAQYHDSTSSPSLLLLQAVCLAGAHSVTVFKNNQELKVALFRRAKALLEGRYEEDRMEMVQAALLLTWFSDGGDDVCANAWWWIGIASRTAIGLGMHREVGPSKMPEGDKKTWRRMWWCLLQFDCLVSLCYGRSQNINLDDSDVQPLRRDDFEDSASQSDVDFVIHHTSLCALVSNFMRSHFTVKATKSPGSRKVALTILDSQLAEWFVALPHEFRDISGGHREDTGASQNALLLHLTYNAMLIQFHRLLINKFPDGQPDAESRAHKDICVESSSNVLQIFEQLSRRNCLQLCWFDAPSFLFSAMLEARSQLNSNNPILALKAKAKEKSGLRSLRSLSRHWLFATSIWRLFRSTTMSTGAGVNNVTTPDAAEANVSLTLESPGQASSIATASSMHLVPLVKDAPGDIGSFVPNDQLQDVQTVADQGESMDWIHFADPSGTMPVNLYANQGRSQQGFNEWQSVYWADPLNDLSLMDEVAGFSFQ